MVVRRNAIRRKASEAPAKEKEERHFWRNSWLDEAAALLCLALALILLLSFFSHAVSLSRAVSLHSDRAAAQANLMGPVGHILATLLFGFMGWCALVPVACLLWFSIYLWRHDQEERPTGLGLSWHSPAGFLGVLIFSCALVSIFAGPAGGGSLGNALATPLVRFLNVWGGRRWWLFPCWCFP